jgi:hypothetical protein
MLSEMLAEALSEMLNLKKSGEKSEKLQKIQASGPGSGDRGIRLRVYGE